MKHNEKTIENLILCYLRDLGLEPWKNETVGRYNVKFKKFIPLTGEFKGVGSPDILAVLPGGRLLAIEVKSKGGKPTHHQTTFLDRINRFGGLALIARSVRDVSLALENILPIALDNQELLRKYEFYEPKEE